MFYLTKYNKKTTPTNKIYFNSWILANDYLDQALPRAIVYKDLSL